MLAFGIVCLMLAWWRTRDGLLLAWSILIALMTTDNRFRLHETVGTAFAAPFEPFGFGPVEGRHLAELAFWAAAAVVIAVVFAVCWRSRTPIGVDASVVLLFLLIGLLHFAAGYDLLHVLTKSNLVAFIEDGGELLCIALISAYAFGVARSVATRVAEPRASESMTETA